MTTQIEDSFADSLPTPTTPRRRWLSFVLALVIFLAGMASGAAVAVVYAVNRIQFAIHHPESAPPRIANAIARRLDLDAAQTAQVETIVARRQTEIAAIRRKFQPEIHQQLHLLRDEVAAVLDESQRSRWSQLFDEFQQRWMPALPARD